MTHNHALRAADAFARPDDFDLAHAAADRAAHAALALDVEPVVVADAFLTAALAVWGADTGRQAAAREFLRLWTEVRDGGR